MLDANIIERSISPWASPLVFVKKKNGGLRMCVDYRSLNEKTIPDAHPIPRIDDALDSLHGAKYFSTLDLKSGYWQIEMSPESVEKTAFSTPFGLFQFKVMPFGLRNAPATFQRLMESAFKQLENNNIIVYLDDIIVFSNTIEEHICHLRECFKIIDKLKIKLNCEKCEFLKTEINYLGFQISHNQIKTDPEKIKSIIDYQTPKNIKDLLQFLGLASYYRDFIKNLSTLEAPLRRLTSKNVKWEWGLEEDKCFQLIKKALSSEPVLTLPDFTKKFIVDCDASNNGIGAVLSQLDANGKEHVIRYGSRILSKEERKYSTTRKELLAIYFGIKRFKPYLWGREFIIRSDHKPIIGLLNSKEIEGQLGRWLDFFAEFNFQIQFREGKKHINADVLSRCNSIIQSESAKEIFTYENVYIKQREDKNIKEVIEVIENKKQWPKVNQKENEKLYILCNLKNSLFLKDGLLFRKYDSLKSFGDRLVVPDSLVQFLLDTIHDQMGHFGVTRVLEIVRSRFFWPKQSVEIKNYCRSCEKCAIYNYPSKTVKEELKQIEVNHTWQKLGMDIVGPLNLVDGYKYILTVVDYFSKWLIAIPIKRLDASLIVKKIEKYVFFRYGIPDSIHTDQGTNFESELFKSVCNSLNIHKSRTSPYHPQGNGLTERANRTLIQSISKTLESDQEWPYILDKVCFFYNITRNDVTGISPYEIMFKRNPNTFLDIMSDFQLPSNNKFNIERMKRSLKLVQNSLKREKEHQKSQYDKSIKNSIFNIGDEVYVRFPKLASIDRIKKFSPQWKGPYEVISIKSPLIEIKSGTDKQFVHKNRCKLAIKRDEKFDKIFIENKNKEEIYNKTEIFYPRQEADNNQFVKRSRYGRIIKEPKRFGAYGGEGM